MRLVIKFSASTEVIGVKDFRGAFISFFKKVFEKADDKVYHYLFKQKTHKPYAFSPYLGPKVDQGILGPQISIIFTSGDFSIISNLWNGILLLKKEKEDYITLGTQKFYLKSVKVRPIKRIMSSQVLFSTVGVSILTNPEVDAKNFKERFLIPERDNIVRFNKVLRDYTTKKFRYFFGVEKDLYVELELFNESQIREVIVPYYKGYLRGFKGSFLLKGDPNVLQFLYDYGFGVRTGQGFGVLEVVKEL
ncbi:MAG: CRISPR-associated endoribonuclease Cas6 [Sulfolobales archaeon]